jgi:hypothetical protein
MVELKTFKFLLQHLYLLPICCFSGVVTARLPHYLIDDGLRISVDVKPVNPKFGSDAQTIH